MPNEVVGFKINGSTYNYDHDHLANLPDIDATPTANSTNAVQSGGVYSALDGLQAEIPTVDATPTQGSNNAVSSGGVYSAIPTIDATLTQSGQAADSKAVGDALANKVDKVTGKGLSTEDYTTAEKTKLAGLTQVEVDDTLSVEGRAADAKVTGDAIAKVNSDLTDAILHVPETQVEAITQDSSELTFYGRGAVSGVNGRFASDTTHDTFLWTPDEDTEVYIVRNSANFLRIIEYNKTLTTLPTSSANSDYVRGAAHESSNDLPSAGDPWTVLAGHTLAISRANNDNYVTKFTLYYTKTVNVVELSDNVKIPESIFKKADTIKGLSNTILKAHNYKIEAVSIEGTSIVVDNEPFSIEYDKSALVSVCGANRFNVATRSFTKNSSNTDAVVTKTETGVKIESNDTCGSNKFVYFNYTPALTGKLWVSVEASCSAYKKNDCRMVITVNGEETPPACVGEGLLKRYVNVVAGDTVQVRLWYHLYTTMVANTVEYKNIMLAYADVDYMPFIPDSPTNAVGKGSVLVFSESTTVAISKVVPAKKYKCVCFGDSITGMFDYGADYCSMIEKNSPIECVNVGFSGSTYTDHPSTHYVPFSVNRLIDSVVAEDFTYQDAHVDSITSDFYSLHLANLKSVDFTDVDFVTFLAGTNDWAFNAPLLSTDDPSTENKQRTNIQDAVKYCISEILTKYPHLTVIVLTPYYRAIDFSSDSDVTPNNNGVYLYQVSDTVLECAKKTRVVCEDLYYNLGANWITRYFYTIDGTHPTTKTKKAIASRIIDLASKSGVMG